MTARVLAAVPNFSEGRDPDVIDAIRQALVRGGAELVDGSADPDHHRSVFTIIGTPEAVEAGVKASARVAVDRIDLRGHGGVHPRTGALDVLPFVPLAGLEMDDARASARRVGRWLAEELGLPVYFYGRASRPPGRGLAGIRRGGFEALVERWPPDRRPDLLPPDWSRPGAHPTAGAVCVGARKVLLAWNVLVEGVTPASARAIASAIRERDGGFHGLRALGLELPSRGAVQISMNLEDPDVTPPMDVFRRIEALAAERGGRVTATEVIGLLPDELTADAAADRLGLIGSAAERMLSRRLTQHLAGRDDDVAP